MYGVQKVSSLSDGALTVAWSADFGAEVEKSVQELLERDTNTIKPE